MQTLTTPETARLIHLERTIEQGLQTFIEVGQALSEIRESWLYRDNHPTFEDYCQERWGMSKRHAYRLMDAAQVVITLKESDQLVTLPANEAQARPLTGLTPQLQREVWSTVVETAPKGHITGVYVEQVVGNFLGDVTPSLSLSGEGDDEKANDSPPPNGYNYKRDARRSIAADIYTPQGMDACQTPAYALDPLLPYLNQTWTIWEPAAGEGLLVEALYDSHFPTIISGDILTGQNFFDYQPDEWDCLVTNPPYSIHFEWLERCYHLGKPFALLLKVEILGTATAQEMISRFGIEIIFVSPRINFKMPFKGWESSAQFPTAWFTWGLNIGRQMTFTKFDSQRIKQFVEQINSIN